MNYTILYSSKYLIVLEHLLPLKYLTKTSLNIAVSFCIASNKVMHDFILTTSLLPKISSADLFSTLKKAFVISNKFLPNKESLKKSIASCLLLIAYCIEVGL